jgi:hypothetical protein
MYFHVAAYLQVLDLLLGRSSSFVERLTRWLGRHGRSPRLLAALKLEQYKKWCSVRCERW